MAGGGLDPRRLARIFANRDYAIYTAGNGLSLIGTWAQRLAAGWLIWELTGSATLLGLLAFVDLFPSVVFAPLGGAMADRMDRRRMLTILQVLGTALGFVLCLFVFTGTITATILILIIFFMGIIDALAQPARLALVNALVPREQIGSAVAFNSIIFNLARLIGPAMAGLLIVSVGVGFAFLANALSFAAFAAALMVLHIARDVPLSRGTRILADIRDGMRHAAAHPSIGPLLLFLFVVGLAARPVIDLLAGFAGEVFEVGPGGLATMASAIAIGGLAAGLFVGSLQPDARLLRLIAGSGIGMTLAAAGFAASPSFELALVLLVLVGVFNVTTFVTAQTFVQLTAEGPMRGRVLSIYGMIFRATPAFGAVMMGAAADLVGMRWPMIVACVVVAGLIVLGWSRLTRDPAPVPEAEPEAAPRDAREG